MRKNGNELTLLLPFSDVDLARIEGRLEKTEREVLDKWSLPYFSEPKNDNERLLNAQRDYISGNAKAAEYLYTKGAEIALRYINTAARKNRLVACLDGATRAEKAHNAAVYIIEQYIKHPEWYIRTSYTGYLYLRVQHELFYKTKADEIVDFVDWENLKNISFKEE